MTIQDDSAVLRTLAEKTGSILLRYHAADDRGDWYGDTEAVLGYAADELNRIGIEAWRAMLHPDDRPAVLEVYEQSAVSGNQFSVEYRVRHKDGHYVYVEESSSALFDDDGQLTGSLGMFRDVTDRRQTIRDLAESEERFRATFQQAAVGIHHVSPDGRYLRINRRFLEMVGYTQAELEAKHFKEITHPDDVDEDMENVQRLLDGSRRTYSMEKRYIRKDGSTLWSNLTVSLVFDTKGEPDYFVSIVEDITDRVRAEAALQQNQQALEAKNIALRELVDQIDAEKRELQMIIRANVERTIRPILNRLQAVDVGRSRSLTNQLERSLDQILSPLTSHLENEYDKLSPREIEVCTMIRNGLTSKEIAESLSISTETVNKFRHLIRKKLGLTNQQVNLRSYLRLLEQKSRR